MATHREMKDLAENLPAVRALAAYLLKLTQATPPVEWTEWELDFLEHMASRDSPEPLSLRQREILVELRDSTTRHSRIDGFSVPSLIERCWLERCELASEADVDFIVALRTSGLPTVSQRQRGRLLRCCRELGIIETHHGYAAGSTHSPLGAGG